MGVGSVSNHIRCLDFLRYFGLFDNWLNRYEAEIVPHHLWIDFRSHLRQLGGSKGSGGELDLRTIDQGTSSAALCAGHLVAAA